MKSKLTLLFSFVAILLTCCYHEEDLPFEHRELFTFTIPPNFNTAHDDHWIIASNVSGEAIAWQSFESGEQVKLSGEVKQGTTTVTITLLTHNTLCDNYGLESFADIPIGSEWTLSGGINETFPIAGYISFRFSDFPESSSSNFVASSMDGAIGTRFIGTSSDRDYSIPQSPCQVFFHMMPYYAGSVPKYMLIDNVNAGDIIDVGFNKLSDYDHIFTAANTTDNLNYAASVRGYHTPIEAHNDRNSHTLTYLENRSLDPLQFAVTYNDGYSFYKTKWAAASKSLTLTSYEKIGAPPTPDNFVMPDYKVRIEGKQVNDFRIASETQFAFNTACG